MEEGVGAESGTSVSIDDNLSLKKDFSIALAKVLSENQDVRDRSIKCFFERAKIGIIFYPTMNCRKYFL